ncbi:MAG: hypothetical protein AAF125_10220, partial [Chloroflexota bacterium]
MRYLSTTWHLWHILKTAPAVRMPVSMLPVHRSTYPSAVGWVVGGIVLYYILLSILGSLLTGVSRALQVMIITVPLIGVGFMFSGTGYGVNWIFRVCGLLVRSEQSGLLDLMSVGAWGRGAALSVLVRNQLHRDPVLNNLPDLEMPLTLGAARTAGVLLLLIALTPGGRTTLLPI